jgi:hypothetical protein
MVSQLPPPPVMLLGRGTLQSCSNCHHGCYRHLVNVDCCDPHRGRPLIAEMPNDRIFFGFRASDRLLVSSDQSALIFARSELVCAL